MKKWLLGVVTGILLCFFLLFFFAGLGWYLQSRPPAISSNTTLILKFDGDIPEQAPQDIAGQLFGEPQQQSLIPTLRRREPTGCQFHALQSGRVTNSDTAKTPVRFSRRNR